MANLMSDIKYSQKTINFKIFLDIIPLVGSYILNYIVLSKITRLSSY